MPAEEHYGQSKNQHDTNIRSINEIDNYILSGAKEGMIRMDDSILSLYNDNLITKETALTYAHRPKELINKLEN